MLQAEILDRVVELWLTADPGYKLRFHGAVFNFCFSVPDSSVSDKQSQKPSSTVPSSSREEPLSVKKKKIVRSQETEDTPSRSTEAGIRAASSTPVTTPPPKKPTAARSKSSTPSEWEVEKIVDKKWMRNLKQYSYQVKWVGNWDLTWEPADYLQGSQEAIEEYEQYRTEERKKKKRESNVRRSLLKKKVISKNAKKSRKDPSDESEEAVAESENELNDHPEISLLEKDFSMSMSPSEVSFPSVLSRFSPT